jgi:taurine dioxygenase
MIMATQLKNTGTITVTPVHPVVGAEVSGIDLSRELDTATIEAIRQAWHDHSVLLFRDQDITGEEQLRFAEHFGAIAERHQPKVGASRVNAAEWTTVMLVSDSQAAIGKEIGITIPSEGGHTKFASLYGAWNNLPDELKQRLEGKRIMQGYDYGCDSRLNLDINLDNIFHFSQPLVVTNPGSGRKALYVSRLNSMWIEGIDREESEKILNQLFDITEDPANYYEHVWRPGDLLMWDNLAVLHARTDWPEEQQRMLRRCTTLGEPLG